jgi:hypothetical protein
VSPEAPEGAREGYSKGRHAQVVRKTELAKTEVVAERPYSERLPTLGHLEWARRLSASRAPVFLHW